LYLRTLRQLAEVNCRRGRRERAEQILDKIERELTTAPLDNDMQFIVSQTQAMLLSYLGRSDEAASITGRLLDHPSAHDDESTDGQELALRAAIGVARAGHDIASLTRHHELLLALEEGKRKPGRRPDRKLIDALRGAADAAIDASDFDRSQELIDQAYTFAMEEFGEDSGIGASVLATRGRLFLSRQQRGAARRDLEKSAAFFRRNPELSEGYLAVVLIHLAYLEFGEGCKRLALNLAREAYDLDLRHYGPDHHETRFDAEIIETIKSFPPTGFRHH
jgi:tetratricopeptide (TPR) repeat protein